MKATLWLLPLAALLIAACGGEAHTYPVPGGTLNTPGGPGQPAPNANWTMTDNVLVTTGLRQQSPTQTDTFNGVIPLGAVGMGAITRGYEFTTPTSTPFAFSVVAVEEGNTGAVTTRIGHSLPVTGTGAEGIYMEGMTIDAPSLVYGGNVWHCLADGAATISVRGSVARSQVLVFEVTTSAGVERIAVRIKIGAQSAVNFYSGSHNSAQTLAREVIYSSDDPGFGLPAIAVSGDRYSVTAYDVNSGTRVRRWLQYDAGAGTTTGGESQSVAADTGSWRDQEIAALNNVLAIAHTGNDAVQVEISLDRGASFVAGQVLDESVTTAFGQRLVQIEIAGDYTIAIVYWRTRNNPGITSELCLVEATPTGFDANATPIGYSYSAPTVMHSVAGGIVPVVMDVEYSSGGDLVIGYGYNEFTGWSVMLNFRCAIRNAAGSVNDFLVEQEFTSWGCDPSVSLLGSGANLTVFYAYEKADGITLRQYRSAGAMPGNVLVQGYPGAYLPSVHARMQGGTVRVDLLFMAPQGLGFSLKRIQWTDFDGDFLSPKHSSLFESSTQAGGTAYSSTVPGKLVHTVGWMGFDAVTDGDDVAITLHRQVCDLYAGVSGGMGAPGAPASPPVYQGSPTLLPGMTGSVPAPNPAHMNQLEVIVID